ncbi:hypothetical protein NA56DRAFT_710166 [Hyaloscypha hepaticicola]|uniref:C2H2-type domain-containing protein n=1 Tax=Hyaloscypha hepaticicola TaxID=2082293 RepID=A0A2J6PMX0_9HELO|nr:hypothetical protein NA56DRAFT_710166 [Hyaloscypha hepaticicola]
MSSSNIYSNFTTRQIMGYLDHSLASNGNFIQSRGSQKHLSEDAASLTAVLSASPDVNWSSFELWNYDSTPSDEQSTRGSISQEVSSNFWSSSDPIYPSSISLTHSPTDLPMSNWNYNSDFGAWPPQSSFAPQYAQLPNPTPLNMCIEAAPLSYTTYHQSGYPTSSHSSIASPQHDSTSSPPFSNRAPKSGSKAKSAPKPKTHDCPHCELKCARASDLQRHIDGVHLRIRHHCRTEGCGNNHGKGYCRLEKLRKHVRDVHGHFEKTTHFKSLL